MDAGPHMPVESTTPNNEIEVSMGGCFVVTFVTVIVWAAAAAWWFA